MFVRTYDNTVKQPEISRTTLSSNLMLANHMASHLGSQGSKLLQCDSISRGTTRDKAFGRPSLSTRSEQYNQ